MLHVELPVASFICAALVLTPLPWHWRAGTVPTIAISLWLFVANIIAGVDSIIWAGNVNIVVPVWCDISTKLIIGTNVALPAAIFSLCVHLERVSSIRQVSTSIVQKRKRQIIDFMICFAIPMIYMALHYIVQGHRFDIVEDLGCRPTTYVSITSIFLVWIPPLTFSIAGCVFAGLAFRNFWMRRITFARHLADSNSALTPSRYFRLMFMALVLMFWGFLIISFNMWFTMKRGLRPWISWDNVHVGFSRIALFPTLLIPRKELVYTYLLWWTIPISSVLFFGFFSFGQDAIKEYRACYLWVRKTIFRVPEVPTKASLGSSLPSYRRDTNDISLPSISKKDFKLPYFKSEATLGSPAPPYNKAVDLFPPSSPTSMTTVTSPTYYASSVTDRSDVKADLDDNQSWADTHSISSHRSTTH